MKRSRAIMGFTLLEVLVVLLLTSMIAALLTQGLDQVFRLQRHFSVALFNTQQGAMQTAWFREAVNGLTPDHPGGKNRFRGESAQFRGITAAPLDAPQGRQVPFTMRLQFDVQTGETRLQYGQDEDSPVIMSWPGRSGRFVYFDQKGETHDQWPPFLGQWPQLPRAIRLEAEGIEGRDAIIAAPKGPGYPLIRLRDAEQM